jgi:subtilisin family serine protease
MRRLAVLTLVLLLGVAAVAPRAKLNTRSKRDPKPYASGQVIVKLTPDSPALQFGDVLEREFAVGGMAITAARSSARPKVEAVAPLMLQSRIGKIVSERGLDRVYVVNVGDDADIESAVAELRDRPDVEYAEPNFRIVPGSIIPDDPRFFDQWGLKNFGFPFDDLTATPNADVKVTDAWEITKGDPGVIVAITDTGVDPTHPDLAANIYTNPREIPGNGIDDDGDGYVDDVHGYNVADNNPDSSDIVGHGTRMSGVVSAGIDNAIGIAGVSRASILPVRFFRKTGPNPSDVDATVVDASRALLYSVAAGATIINASWRSLGATDGVTDEQLGLLQDAVYATSDAGALLVSIAGNEGYNNDTTKVYPGAFQLPNQIVVAASDFNDEIWHDSFSPFTVHSGYGPKTVHIAAPGVAVATTTPFGTCGLCSSSTNPADWYARDDGTSYSAAFVSGVAALVKTQHPNDNGIMLKARILKGVDVIGALAPYVSSSGRLNAVGAILADVQLTITPPVLSKVKYKDGKGKLLLFGTQIQNGARVIVAGKGYTTTPQTDDNTQLLARVPRSAFPAGAAVPVKLKNPDGGESQILTITR